MSGFVLPDAPADFEKSGGAVKAWAQPVVIPTYLPLPADKNPMFLEKRVYQGSSGKVYPLPFTDRISEEKNDRAWEALHIENEFVRLMILPELGGRIHVGLDKTNGYDFFYRQNVIKPALVGLAGPWISGGVEFNWPQHHRPSTFMRCEWEIEKHADGSATIWCGEHEPMNRMKGMHGICLRPGSSLIELKVRIYNRTAFVQTFLWWANVAVRVHAGYQSFFPGDVAHVADHAKRAMSAFPLCDAHYYGVDYAGRAAAKHPELGYPGNDLSWYDNIPVPTSYMAMGSKEDFFGGYDHVAKAGFVHVADHHIAPGKKQWTWGNAAFGKAWDKNLSDDSGPYIELMAGVYTDNQPDFSWLMPGETRSWSQYWYPIRAIGPASRANVDGAVSLTVEGKKIRFAAQTTRLHERALVQIWRGGEILHQCPATLSPAHPLVMEYVEPAPIPPHELRAYVVDASGKVVVQYQPPPPAAAGEKPEIPPAAKEPALPADVASIEELYLIGLHLEQYRHATRMPETYWEEALKREPGDVRCNVAMGWWRLRRGEFGKAVKHFRTAIATLTKFNPNPREGEAYYGLGVALRFPGTDNEGAYDALAKAAWNGAFRAAALFELARLDCVAKRWETALGRLQELLTLNAAHLQARSLTALILMRMNRGAESRKLLEETVQIDRLDFAARLLLGKPLVYDRHMRLDVAMDWMKAGFYREALESLLIPEGGEAKALGQAGLKDELGVEVESGATKLIYYACAHLLAREKLGAASAWAAGKDASPEYCFPSRLEEIGILLAAIAADETDARAPYYLGNLLYDKRRREEAISWWEKSAKLDRAFPTVWRNLGIAYYNVYKDVLAAKGAYERAFKANSADARVLYERDQLWKRTGETPERRLEELQFHVGLVLLRDDLTLEWCALLNQLGQPEKALAILKGRRFQPWEGGEGLALGQWARTHIALGRRALWKKEVPAARDYFAAGLAGAENLGEAAHLLANQSELHYWAGAAARAAGDEASARKQLSIAAESNGDFRDMSVCAFSEATYYSALALKELGRVADGRKLLEAMEAFAQKLRGEKAQIDYFATSLPAMLLFDDDLQARQEARARLLEALALHGLGDYKTARRLLGDLLRDDPNHAVAADALQSLASD